jgi:4'-phosphopantetheinyl transferase
MEGMPGRIEVWTLPVSPAVLQDHSLPKLLSSEENLRINRFHKPEDRARYIVAHVGLRSILDQYFAIHKESQTFDRTRAGKPFLVKARGNDPIYFSLAHSGALVLIAVSRDMEIGVDVEAMDPTIDLSDATAFCTPVEISWLSRLQVSQRISALYRIWTIKEALAKAQGVGLRISLVEISVDLSAPDRPEVRHAIFPSRPWFVEELKAPLGYASAIAGLTNQAMVRQLDASFHDGELLSH